MVFLASTVSLAEIPLPSYRDDLALTSWYEVNDRIEDACLRDRETQQCVGWDGEILDDAIAMADRFQDYLYRDARLEYLTGLAYKLSNNNSKAKARYRAAVHLDPNRVDAWHDLGEVYLADGQFDQAKEAFSQVNSLLPTGPKAWVGPWRLAEVAAHQQDPVAFEEQMREALRRGFSFRQIEGLPNWKAFYADPVMGDSVAKLITVYGS
ncbi:MAG: tetratricopeptide repeat protein, partial [Proteobacteria bacterium]|nr:tetratricopeptide repeat protein [Pseudomonadota bacterium]